MSRLIGWCGTQGEMREALRMERGPLRGIVHETELHPYRVIVHGNDESRVAGRPRVRNEEDPRGSLDQQSQVPVAVVKALVGICGERRLLDTRGGEVEGLGCVQDDSWQ